MELVDGLLARKGVALHYWTGGPAAAPLVVLTHGATVDHHWNFQQLTALETVSLKAARPIFKLYPYKTLVNQSLAVTATSKASQDLLRPAMESLSKDEFVEILMATSACLHYEPGYTIDKPLLLMVGDDDSTGNIRKAMPRWAEQESDCRLVVIPNAKHAANLDNPDFFHRTLMDFLTR